MNNDTNDTNKHNAVLNGVRLTMPSNRSILSLTDFNGIEEGDDIGVNVPYYITNYKTGKKQKLLVWGQYQHGNDVRVWEKRLSKEMQDQTLVYLVRGMRKTHDNMTQYWNTTMHNLLKEIYENGGKAYCKHDTNSEYVKEFKASPSDYVEGKFSLSTTSCFAEDIAELKNEKLAEKAVKIYNRHDTLCKRWQKFYNVFQTVIEKKYYELKEKRSCLPTKMAAIFNIDNEEFVVIMYATQYENSMEIFHNNELIRYDISEEFDLTKIG